MKQNRSCLEWFRWSAVVVLLLTAAAKLVSAGGHAPVLDLPDPLFGVSTRLVLVGVGLLEVVIASALVLPMRAERQFLALAWLMTAFLVYRLGLAWSHPGTPCPCLGTWTERLHLSERTVGMVLSTIVIYLLLGSILGLRAARRTGITRV